MSSTSHAPAGSARRVRHDVRDGIAVMVFSAAASTGLAALLLLFGHFVLGAGN